MEASLRYRNGVTQVESLRWLRGMDTGAARRLLRAEMLGRRAEDGVSAALSRLADPRADSAENIFDVCFPAVSRVSVSFAAFI